MVEILTRFAGTLVVLDGFKGASTAAAVTVAGSVAVATDIMELVGVDCF